MKIVVAARCRDEAEMLPTFLANYPFADEIVIADGGSTDGSKAIAEADPRVRWMEFHGRIPGKTYGTWCNPEGPHLNFLLQQCAGADWIWLADLDEIPSIRLQEVVRETLESMQEDGQNSLQTWLVNVAPGCKEYYPGLMLGPGWCCVRPGIAIAGDAYVLDGHQTLIINDENPRKLGQEAPRIHLTFQSEELVAKKQQYYLATHDWTFKHPDSRCGPRAPLPEYAKWVQA